MRNRRELIALLGGVAVWPYTVRAQQPPTPVIGFLSGGSLDSYAPLVAAFRQALGEAGFVEGRTIAIEYRWAEGQTERLPALAADLVRLQVALIAATGGTAVGLAAKAATTTIPIVFTSGGDPVRLGLVASLSRPGGNVTGAVLLTSQLEAKRFGLLRELVPGAALIAVLLDPSLAAVASQSKDVEDAARAVGQQIRIFHARTEAEIDAAFAGVTQARAGALLVGASPFFNSRRTHIVALAARHAVPAIYELREYALAGGLMSYGTNFADSYRQAGRYAGRIHQSTKVELVINLKTAKALGLTFPLSLLGRADEVSE